MSTGAELSVVVFPVGMLGVALVAGAAAAAAGIVVVGGVAVAGTGRLMISAGSYARDRLQERADLCAGEYERFLQLRARARERQAVKPQLNQSRWSRHVAEESAVPQITTPILQNLTELQARHDEVLRHTERHAQLAAALQIHGPLLDLELASRARAALGAGDEKTLVRVLAELRGAVARADLDVLSRAQAALGAHRLEVADLLTYVTDPELHSELSAWHSQVNAMLGSRDLRAVLSQLSRGERLLDKARERHAEALHRLRAGELNRVWGLLQASQGLVSDLQLIVASDVHADQLRRDVSGLAGELTTLTERYEHLAIGPVSDVASLRAAAAELMRGLDTLTETGLHLLDRYSQGQMAAQVKACLDEMCIEEEAFTRVEERTRADGVVMLAATDGSRTLELRVRADGRVAYDVDGFGDETCLGAIYSLRSRLRLRGVQVEMADPQLKPQIAVALEALEAISQLGTYPVEEISIQRSGSAIVIEAGAGAAFQRQLASVDQRGRVTYAQELPAIDLKQTQPAVQRRVVKERSNAQNREREMERRKQRQRMG